MPGGSRIAFSLKNDSKRVIYRRIPRVNVDGLFQRFNRRFRRFALLKKNDSQIFPGQLQVRIQSNSLSVIVLGELRLT